MCSFDARRERGEGGQPFPPTKQEGEQRWKSTRDDTGGKRSPRRSGIPGTARNIDCQLPAARLLDWAASCWLCARLWVSIVRRRRSSSAPPLCAAHNRQRSEAGESSWLRFESSARSTEAIVRQRSFCCSSAITKIHHPQQAFHTYCSSV